MSSASSTTASSRSFRREGGVCALLGDGFEADTLLDLYRVTSWNETSSDELMRFFPRLATNGQTIPSAIRARLAECLSVLLWRSARNETSARVVAGARVTRPSLAEALSLGVAPEERWFVPPSLVESVVRRIVGAGANAAPRPSEWAAIEFLNQVLSAGPQAATPGRAELASFAFFTGIHPAYLWSTARCEITRYVACAWVGWLARGRRAIVLPEVAEFLTVLPPGGDEDLSRLFGRPVPWKSLLRAARRASEGGVEIVGPPLLRGQRDLPGERAAVDRMDGKEVEGLAR